MSFFTVLEKLTQSNDRYIKGASTQLIKRKKDILEVLKELDRD